MRIVCGWCEMDLGWRQGPEGETTHGICQACKDREMANLARPFSVKTRVSLVVGFVAWLLLSGWAGECDRQDALDYEPVRAEIVAGARSWAVTR